MEEDRRKIIISWCLYDWANSAFATTVMAAVLPVFYSSVAGANLSKTTASSYWGYTNTIAMLLVAFSAPLLGAMADHGGIKKKFLAAFALLGIISTTCLFFYRKRRMVFSFFSLHFRHVGFFRRK